MTRRVEHVHGSDLSDIGVRMGVKLAWCVDFADPARPVEKGMAYAEGYAYCLSKRGTCGWPRPTSTNRARHQHPRFSLPLSRQ